MNENTPKYHGRLTVYVPFAGREDLTEMNASSVWVSEGCLNVREGSESRGYTVTGIPLSYIEKGIDTIEVRNDIDGRMMRLRLKDA